MRTRIGSLRIAGGIAVAVLSVFAIPIAAAIIDSKKASSWIATILIVFVSVVVLIVIIAVLSLRYLRDDDIEWSESSVEVQLLGELSGIERQARILLAEDHPLSVIQLRERLRDMGIWSDADVFDFDVALRRRNQVAHGEQKDLSKTDVEEAVRVMQHLRQALVQRSAVGARPPSASRELSAGSYSNLLSAAELERWNVAEILMLIEEYLNGSSVREGEYGSGTVSGADWMNLHRNLKSITEVE